MREYRAGDDHSLERVFLAVLTYAWFSERYGAGRRCQRASTSNVTGG